jgi:hypothetical protein
LAACGADIGSDNSFAKDSFAKPTDHGELVFTDGARNEATFTETTRYHAWTFTLTDDAEVDLQTGLETVNLDSVMYLYRWDAGEELWGSYIRKNDNHQGQMYSRIKSGLAAGEYRVKVQATHPMMVGKLNLAASCTGDGCPAVDTGVCEPTHGSGTYTEGCGERIRGVVMAPVTSESSTTIKYEDRCNHPNVEAQAATAYHDYWNGYIGWDDFANEEGEMYATTRRHGDAGTVVSIDVGGDEDGVSFLFDAAGTLLMYFHSEQSSSTWYSCGVAGEPTVEEPDTEECGQALLHDTAHSTVDTSDGTTSTTDAESDLGAFAAAGVSYFATEQGLSASDSIAYRVTSWESGAELELSANGSTSTLILADKWGDTYLAMQTEGGVTTVKCENLD